MTEVVNDQLPISCISCRRKKIKCNKKKPCNQCIKRNVVCEFPSTFRNIKVDLDNSEEPSLGNPDGMLMNKEYQLLRNEYNTLLENNSYLAQENLRLMSKINGIENGGKVKEEPEAFPVTGETSESGPKYYGPQSSNFMFSNLIDKTKPKVKEESARPGMRQFGSTVSIDPNTDFDFDRHEDAQSVAASHRSSNIVEQSLTKKSFPEVVYRLHRRDSSDILNREVVIQLVEHFFASNSYYYTFLPREQILSFIKDYPNMKDREWENDDDLLLLYIILAITIYRMSSHQCVEFKLIDSTNVNKFSRIKQYLCRDVLFHNFNRLRHNLLNESVVSVMAYIVCTEYLFMEQKYEEAWSMAFHTCSISYAIGIHIMGKVRQQSNTTGVGENIDNTVQDFSNEVDDITDQEEKESDLIRYKLWYALRNLMGQICSLLGRPNPISIHVNKVIQLSVLEQNTIQSDRLENQTAHVLLKVGSSECLRLSNLMLIENFMINFDWDDLYSLGAKFTEEITVLEWALAKNCSPGAAVDPITHLPCHCDRRNVMSDLITLYANQAKLYEPFISKSTSSVEIDTAVKSMIAAIFKMCDYSISFLREAVGMIIGAYGVHSLDEATSIPQFRFGRMVRSSNPFLHAFFYQGIVVIFTFIHYKYQDFIRNGNDPTKLVNSTVLDRIEHSIREFIQFDQDVTNKHNGSRMWSPNVMYLLNKIISRINKIRSRQVDEDDGPNAKRARPASETDSELASMNVHDPMWFTSPENIPYYMNSPPSEDEPSTGTLLSTEVPSMGSYPPPPQLIPDFQQFSIPTPQLHQHLQGGAPVAQYPFPNMPVDYPFHPPPPPPPPPNSHPYNGHSGQYPPQ